MRHPSIRLAQVVVLVGAAGCVRAGFEDTRSRDSTMRDVLRDVLSPTDRRGPADEILSDAGDPQRIPPAIAACQATCTGGADCDGLPDHRDPEPTACNELLFEETFAAAPQGWSTTGGSWRWQPGWYAQPAATDLAWTRADGAALPTADYLVEARFRLGPLSSSAAGWLVAVVGRFVSQDRYIYGGITVEPAYSPAILKPDLIIRSRRDARPYTKDPATSGYSEGYPSDVLPNYTPPTFDTAAGREYYLQLYYTQSPQEMVTCLLYDETSLRRQAVYALWAYPACKPHLPTEPGTVGFHTKNRGADLDFIRVFRLHKTGPGGG